MSKSLFPSFEPHPLLRGGHAQTLAGVYLPSKFVASQPVVHRIMLEDGDQIVLHDDRPAGWGDGQGTCLLMHGLAGSHASGYMERCAAKLVARGIRVFRMDLRGCGAGEGLARGTTHCARWDDTAAALKYIASEAPASPTALVGFSLGGTISLNLAIELGNSACGNLVGVLAICPPIDLHAVKARFQEPTGRPYDRHFVRSLWQKTLARMEADSGFPRVDPARRPRLLGEFDNLITAPLAGYKSGDDYYTQASPGPRLREIRLPTTILTAADDPVVPAEPLRDAPISKAVDRIITRHGGHLGYVARRNGDADRRWMDWRVVEWVLHTMKIGVPLSAPQ